VLSDFFYFSSGTTMIAAVFLSMRLIAEERQNGTLVLLTSSAVHDRAIILGKFFSAFAFLAMVTLATAFMPALIMVNGKLSIGQVAAGYLGLLLLGGAAWPSARWGQPWHARKSWPPFSRAPCWWG